MKEVDVFDLFRQHARVDTKLFVQIPVYTTVPMRRPKRKKRRLQKKWLKRYGTKREVIHIVDREIHGYQDLEPSERQHPILMRRTARVNQLRMAHTPAFNTYNEPPDATIPITYTTYQFPVVGSIQQLSPEFLEDYERDPQLLKYLDDAFYRTVEKAVREKTTINGFSGSNATDLQRDSDKPLVNGSPEGI